MITAVIINIIIINTAIRITIVITSIFSAKTHYWKDSDLVSLVNFSLSTTYFKYNDIHYQQIFAAATGSPDSTAMANLVMKDFEQKALSTCTTQPLLKSYTLFFIRTSKFCRGSSFLIFWMLHPRYVLISACERFETKRNQNKNTQIKTMLIVCIFRRSLIISDLMTVTGSKLYFKTDFAWLSNIVTSSFYLLVLVQYCWNIHVQQLKLIVRGTFNITWIRVLFGTMVDIIINGKRCFCVFTVHIAIINYKIQ